MPYIEIATEDLEEIETRILPFRAPLSAEGSALENVLVEPSAEGLLWAATDSYRMGSLHRGDSDLDRRVVFDASLVTFVARAATRIEADTVRFEIDEDGATITLVLPGVRVPRPLREFEYPDVQQFLDDVPRQSPVELRVQSEHLRAAVYATCSFNESLDEERSVVALRTTPDGSLRVIAQWTDIPDTSAEIDAASDGPVDTVVNATYLLTLLDATDAQELTLLVGAPTDPLRVRSDDGFRSLVMPINVGQHDLERKIADVLGIDRNDLYVDEDGRIPVTIDEQTVTVRLLPNNDPFRRGSTVRFEAEVIRGISPTPELLVEINDLNGQTLNCRVVHVGDAVHVYAENLLETLDEGEIVAICHEVARNAATFGLLLRAVHG